MHGASDRLTYCVFPFYLGEINSDTHINVLAYWDDLEAP